MSLRDVLTGLAPPSYGVYPTNAPTIGALPTGFMYLTNPGNAISVLSTTPGGGSGFSGLASDLTWDAPYAALTAATVTSSPNMILGSNGSILTWVNQSPGFSGLATDIDWDGDYANYDVAAAAAAAPGTFFTSNGGVPSWAEVLDNDILWAGHRAALSNANILANAANRFLSGTGGNLVWADLPQVSASSILWDSPYAAIGDYAANPNMVLSNNGTILTWVNQSAGFSGLASDLTWDAPFTAIGDFAANSNMILSSNGTSLTWVNQAPGFSGLATDIDWDGDYANYDVAAAAAAPVGTFLTSNLGFPTWAEVIDNDISWVGNRAALSNANITSNAPDRFLTGVAGNLVWADLPQVNASDVLWNTPFSAIGSYAANSSKILSSDGNELIWSEQTASNLGWNTFWAALDSTVMAANPGHILFSNNGTLEWTQPQLFASTINWDDNWVGLDSAAITANEGKLLVAQGGILVWKSLAELTAPTFTQVFGTGVITASGYSFTGSTTTDNQMLATACLSKSITLDTTAQFLCLKINSIGNAALTGGSGINLFLVPSGVTLSNFNTNPAFRGQCAQVQIDLGNNVLFFTYTGNSNVAAQFSTNTPITASTMLDTVGSGVFYKPSFWAGCFVSAAYTTTTLTVYLHNAAKTLIASSSYTHALSGPDISGLYPTFGFGAPGGGTGGTSKAFDVTVQVGNTGIAELSGFVNIFN